MSAWVLPDHIADVLPSEARHIEELRRQLLDTARGYGYELVMPPLLEHLESLLSGTGEALDLQTFKLVDQLSGPQHGPARRHHAAGRAHRRPPAQPPRRRAPLLLRPGAAHPARPPARHARAAAVRRRDLRPCRPGSRHRSAAPRARLPARGRRAPSPSSSTWPMRASCAALFAGVPVDAACIARVHAALAAKDASGAARAHGGLSRRRRARACSRCCSSTATPRCSTRRPRPCPTRAGVREALADLKQLAGALEGARVSFDLADLRGYAYYSGMRFGIYTRGASDALVRGGRYDEVGAVFGRNRPAVGFSLDVRELVGVLPARPAAAPRSARPGATRQALRAQTIAALRSAGRNRGLRAARPRQRDRRIPLRPRARRASAGSGTSKPSESSKAKHHERYHRPKRGRRRHPVGRRGQGQAGRLADRERAGRGALPGRPQRGPHAGHQRREDGAAPDPQRHHAARRQVLHRQRRGAVGGQAVRGDRGAGEGRRRGALAPAHQRGLPADPAVPRRARHRARGLPREGRHREDRHHRPRHRPGLRGQDRAPRAARAGPQAPGALRRQAARAARPAQLRADAGAERAGDRLRRGLRRGDAPRRAAQAR